MFVSKISHQLLVVRATKVGFLWGVAEATVFFILPDFFLAPAIIAQPKNAWRLVASIAAGSALGALLVTVFVIVAPYTTHDFITSLPFTTDAMTDKANQFVGNPLYSFSQPLSGIPMKAWTWSMVTGGASFVVFFAAMMLGRIFRFGIVAAISLIVERFFGATLRRHGWAFFTLYTVIFFVWLAIIAARF